MLNCSFLKLKVVVLCVIALCFGLKIKAQCTWKTALFDGFEYASSITSPDFLPNICYGVPHPDTYAHHTGNQAVYVNFIDSTNTSPTGVLAGTLFYSKTITVCLNMQYRVSSWFCTTFSGVQCNLKIVLKDGSGAIINSVNSFPCMYAPAFSQYTSGVFTPTVSTIILELYTNVGGTAGNDLGMDDLLIERCVPGGAITTQTTVCTPSPAFDLYTLFPVSTPTYGIWSGPSALANGYLGNFDPPVNSQGSYAYSYLFQNDSACPIIKDTVKVFSNSTPTLAVNTVSICMGQQTAMLIASGATTYTWSPSTILSTASGATVMATPSVSTTYTIVGANGTCQSTTTTSVTVNPLPVLTVSSATICAGSSATLTASGASTYSWSPASTLNTSSGSVVIANPAVTTVYSIAGSVGSCTSVTTASVTVEPNPLLNATSKHICAGTSATLTVTGATNYLWLPSAYLSANTGSVVISTPPSTMTYSVVGMLGICSATVVSTVTVSPVPVLSVNSATLCYGTSTTLTVSGASSYIWSPDNSLNASTTATVSATPSVTTNYVIIGTTGICSSSVTSFVLVDSVPHISLQASSLVSNTPGETITLTSSGGNTYNWSNGFNSNHITINPYTTTKYCVTVTYTNTGCLSDTCMTIEVIPESTLYIPNTFTPNGDELNDTFLTPGTNILEYYLWIFNRWGTLIFESADMKVGWDGKEKGTTVPDDVYTYLVMARGIDEKIYKKAGHITIIK